jgi:hypothetical protein
MHTDLEFAGHAVRGGGSWCARLRQQGGRSVSGPLCDKVSATSLERNVVIGIDAAGTLGSLKQWACGRVVGQEFIDVLGDRFGTSTLPRKRLML